MQVPETLQEKLQAMQQSHVLQYFDTLTEAEQAALIAQLEGFDWDILSYAAACEHKQRGVITPIASIAPEERHDTEAQYRTLGLQALKEGKVAAVLLAGGQGSRLGYEGPKGCMDFGETREVSLFGLHFATIKRYAAESGGCIPLFIMTSTLNHDATVSYLEAHDYFGYPKADVHFFTQEMAFGTDFDGKLLMESPCKVVEAPNGNGGWFSSMVHAGLLKLLKAQGIAWLNVFAVDNALQQIADPCFIGGVIESGCECGAKTISKADPEEKVGVLCLEDGKPSIIEYIELEEPYKSERGPDGRLTYRCGVILNYLFSLERLLEIVDTPLPIYRVKKKLTYMDAQGNIVKPDKPNAYKYETLVLDMVRLHRDCLVYEVEREKEFAPIKQAKGVDSLETAKAMLKATGISL